MLIGFEARITDECELIHGDASERVTHGFYE